MSTQSTLMNTSNDMNLKDVEGIGPSALTKLKKAEILSVQDLASNSAESLAEIAGIGKDLANTWIQNAYTLLREQGFLGNEFVTGSEYLVERDNLVRIKTGASIVDDWLGGGVESGAITELYGEFGSGKSQFCHVLSINAVTQLNGSTIYYDTEGTFRPERIRGICVANAIDYNPILDNIHLCKIENAGHLEIMINALPKFIEKWNTKLVVVDSIIALHRSEFSGRGTLAERQQKLNQVLHRLLRVAELYKVVVVITNQVTTSPDTFFGDPTKPTGGNIIGHSATYRISLKHWGKKRVATMVDSPYHENVGCQFLLTAKGIENDPEDPKAKKKEE